MQLDFGIKEIRAGIAIMQAWVDDFQLLAIGCQEFFQWKNLMFPDVMKQLFHVNEL